MKFDDLTKHVGKEPHYRFPIHFSSDDSRSDYLPIYPVLYKLCFTLNKGLKNYSPKIC